jgi:alkane 1-monooxygenase
MDKRVMGHYDGDLSKANVHPRTAAKYARKYAA